MGLPRPDDFFDIKIYIQLMSEKEQDVTIWDYIEEYIDDNGQTDVRIRPTFDELLFFYYNIWMLSVDSSKIEIWITSSPENIVHYDNLLTDFKKEIEAGIIKINTISYGNSEN